jgi:putative SOS response-associated peptidase YedK
MKFTQLRWGFPPARPKAPPVINFRSEGRRFPVGRCLVPASHFFEFTGKKSPKTKWKFTKAGEGWFCFAGLWRPMQAGGDAFTLLTTEPGADVAPIYNRQMVILERSHWSAWLEQTRNEVDLLRALPAGSLAVKQVR